MPMQLYNTLTRKKEPLVPQDPSRITFYTCGPTVYDDAHIGNFRSFLAADLLRRWLESPLCELMTESGETHAGPRVVRHIMNITDVGHMTDDDVADGGGEDKMQAAAKRLLEQKKAGASHIGEVDPNDPRQIADFYAGRFLEDARALGLKVALEANESEAKRRELMPKATESIAGMRKMIEDLASKGFAYRAGDAVYFDVQKYDRYGELSGNTLDNIRSGAGGRVADEHTAEKRSPADFLLWKADASHLMRWPGPVIGGEAVGEGYPGWHIECSVMARAALGDVIDLHSGGEDNIFPHHECERAQSCCATGNDTFARHWFHGRFLQVEGEKMSKSKGNFFTARDLFAQGHEPAAVRLELIKTHFMTNANFTQQGLVDSKKLIRRWIRRIHDIHAFLVLNTTPPTDDRMAKSAAYANEMTTIFSKALNDNLNAGDAIATYGMMIKQLVGSNYLFCRDVSVPRPGYAPTVDNVNKHLADAIEQLSGDSLQIIRSIAEQSKVLGLFDTTLPRKSMIIEIPDLGVSIELIDIEPPDLDRVGDLAKERVVARASKDFATSDAIRDELAGKGYAIKDVAGGKVEVSRK